MDMKLQKAADTVRTAVNKILNGPIPEAFDEDRFEMFIPNFKLENESTTAVRVIVNPNRMLINSDLGEMRSECEKNVTEAMNKLNSEMTQTRAVLHRGHINMEAACFIYTEHEHREERIENVIMRYLSYLCHNSSELKAANEPDDIIAAAEPDKLPAGSRKKINFHLFDN